MDGTINEVSSVSHIMCLYTFTTCVATLQPNILTSQDLVDVFNNILNDTNQVGWTELQTVSAGSQTLLQNAERYGTYLANTVNNTDEPLTLIRENISELIYAHNDITTSTVLSISGWT